MQEHTDLIASIRAGKPLNELKNVAESTLTAIMGRMSAYTGKEVSWDDALNSKLKLYPGRPGLGHEARGAGNRRPRQNAADLSDMPHNDKGVSTKWLTRPCMTRIHQRPGQSWSGRRLRCIGPGHCGLPSLDELIHVRPESSDVISEPACSAVIWSISF